MNNPVFGKTMENVQKRDNIKIVRSDKREKIRTLIAPPLFSNDLVGFNMHKESVKQEKPFYAGMMIPHNNKILMNDFYYNELKRQYDLKFELIYTDTAFCWRFKQTKSTRTWKAVNTCTTQAIIPKITRFTAAQTKQFKAR